MRNKFSADKLRDKSSTVQRFLLGARCYWRGFRTWSTNPQLMRRGLIPVAITAAIFALIVVIAAFWVDDLARVLVARTWGSERTGAGLITLLLSLALFAVVVMLLIYTFVAIATVIGTPYFQSISAAVDTHQGPFPEAVPVSARQSAIWGITEGFRLLLISVPISLLVFLAGLVPVLGVALAFVLGAGFGGWLLALEFTAWPFERRGLRLAGRRAYLQQHRATAIGFGATAYLMSLIPVVGLLMMPSAVSGGTYLARHCLGEKISPPLGT